MKKFAITYEMLSTRIATVKANSVEEALQNFNNEYNIVDDCEDDSYIRNIHEHSVTEIE